MGNAEINGVTTCRQGGITGRGFRKGQSGNPNGRPRGFAARIREETNDGKELVDLVFDIMRGGRGASAKLQLEAASWLADRGFGRPVQATDINGPNGGPIAHGVDLGKLTAAELGLLETLVERLTSRT
jgi:hypothetical protein